MDEERTIGWVQLNNTLLPFVKRDNIKLLPIAVLKNAMNLLSRVSVSGIKITTVELEDMNQACEEAGLTFRFTLNCRMMKLEELQELESSNLHTVKILPDDSNPFLAASYKESIASEEEHTSLINDQDPPKLPPVYGLPSPKTMALVNTAIKMAKIRQHELPVRSCIQM